MHSLDLLKDICQDVVLSVCGPVWSTHAVFSSLALWSAVWSLLRTLPVTEVVANSHNNNTALSTSARTLCLHTYYKHTYTQLWTVTNEWTNSSGSLSLWHIQEYCLEYQHRYSVYDSMWEIAFFYIHFNKQEINITSLTFRTQYL